MQQLISSFDLTEDIRYHDYRDTLDKPYAVFVPYVTDANNPEFSICNQEVLKESFLSIKDTCKIIVEIGVHRDAINSSTNIFLNNKNDDTYYIGVDIEDKSYLNNPDKRIHTIMSPSQNVLDVMMKIQEITNTPLDEIVIDYLFIDGWHSILQVLVDWEYTRAVKDGVICFHDTNYHPGPKRFIEKLNLDRFSVEKKCPLDYGITVIRRK